VDLIPGLRRVQPPDLESVGHDEALAERIRNEIRHGGPITFARFMDLALYDPDGGYYRGSAPRPGRDGDFLTAPELHPIFGATLSGLVVDTWEGLGRPSPFVVREYGAGTGALALATLDALRTDGEPALASLTYDAIDVDPRRSEAFAARLREAGFAHVLRPDGGVPDAGGPVGGGSTTARDPVVGLILANEVLDALPVHRVRQRGTSLREIAVALDDVGGFADVEIEPSTPALAARLETEGITLVDGQTTEICLAADRWIASVADGLTRGLAIFIDYGAVAAERYDPVRRRDGTLRAFVAHQVHDDPYRHVGRQDLTAHVDVTATVAAANEAGLTSVGVTTQAEALMGLGIERRLQAIQNDPATSMEDYLALRASMLRLMDPAAMGRFRVMAFGREWPPDGPLRALAYRIPPR
jgi:SAM-dependent MidA family methyltransferase